ncbi:MAG TPA: uracil-DNA glycosylase family protein [Gemmatimonadaceae bacterium]|nr:uracil-DNA glycosylase family protein [Gemmatimonadaceae bacterium]
MDARERLRRYLEQRREMGERELILDGMSVEEVMRIVGAGAGAQAEAPAAPRPSEPAVTTTNRPTAPPETRPAAPETPDWREVLRGTGSEPSRATNLTRPSPPTPAAPRMESPQAEPSQPAPADIPPLQSRYIEPPPPPEPDDFDDDDAPEDAVASRPAYVMKPTPQTVPTVKTPVPPAGEPPAGLVVGAPSRELFTGPLSGFTTLEQLAEEIAKCTKCPLYRTATKPVPGQGNPAAELVCVGEAPGENEDKSGLAFVGMAGQLLTKILAAINLSREDVFICNVLKHRPPGNRNPNPQEVEACSPYLVRQLEIIRPKVIVAFGTFAAQTLLDTKLSIGKLRGQIHRYYGIPLVVTYHPAALLRNPAWKRPTWEDVQLARRVLDRPAGA